MGAQRSLDQAAQLTWFGEPYKADQAKAKLNNRRCRVLIKKPESTVAHSTSSTKSPKTVFISLWWLWWQRWWGWNSFAAAQLQLSLKESDKLHLGRVVAASHWLEGGRVAEVQVRMDGSQRAFWQISSCAGLKINLTHIETGMWRCMKSAFALNFFSPQNRIFIIFSSSLIESWSLSSSHHQLGELDTWGLIPLFQTQSIHHQSSSPVSRGLNCQWILRNCVLCYTSHCIVQSEPRDKVHQDRIQMWTKLEYKSAPKVHQSEGRVHQSTESRISTNGRHISTNHRGGLITNHRAADNQG